MDDFKTLLSVESIADKSIASIKSSETITSLAKVIEETGSGSVLILDDGGSLTGIVTESDIVRRGVAKDLDLNNATASDIMSSDPITIPSDESIFEARKIMETSNAHHLIVIKGDKPFGILTSTAVMGNK